MRWPIQRQLLWPLLFVIVVSIVLTSAVAAYMNVRWARHQQQENLEQVVGTLTGSGFPLTETVLEQMSGLSGAEFVVLDQRARVLQATLETGPQEIAALAKVPSRTELADLEDRITIPIAGQRYLCDRLTVASPPGTGPSRSLLVLLPEYRWQAPVRQAVLSPLVVGAGAVLAAVVMATLLARRFVRPIQRLQQQAALVAGGHFESVPLGQRDDEIRDLTRSLNQMAEQLARYEEQVRTSERLRTLGQLGGGIAHQLRNSATGARMALELHAQECPLGPGSETLEVVARQLQLMETYLQRFLTLGRTATGEMHELQFDELVAEVLDLLEPMCQHARVKIDYQPPGSPLTVRGDRDALRQLLVNLVVNAVEAANRPDAQPQVGVELASVDNNKLRLTVRDNGPGPQAEVAERLFQPFVSEKPDGTGLGLAVSKQVAEEHAGSIRWQREQDMTCFIVELPRVEHES